MNCISFGTKKKRFVATFGRLKLFRYRLDYYNNNNNNKYQWNNTFCNLILFELSLEKHKIKIRIISKYCNLVIHAFIFVFMSDLMKKRISSTVENIRSWRRRVHWILLFSLTEIEKKHVIKFDYRFSIELKSENSFIMKQVNFSWK